MTYGRVHFASHMQVLDGAAVSHLAELVRGHFLSTKEKAPSSAAFEGTFSPRDSPAKRDGRQCWLSIWREGAVMGEQMSLAEALLHPKLGVNTKLAGMHGQVDWTPIGQLAGKVRAPAATGRKPYRPLPMLKIIYLQAAYNLGDKEMEEALADRLSFRRFCGFGLEEGTPDETTIWRFREAAMIACVLEAAFAEIDPQLETKGLILKKGTLLYATLVAAKHAPPRVRQVWVPRIPGSRTRAGPRSAATPTSATRRTLASTRARRCCAASLSPRP